MAGADAIAAAERMAELARRRADLAERLAESLALESFAGRPIFEHGRVRTYTQGAGRVPDSSWRFVAELGNGETLAWPLADVPPRLWPKLAATMRESMIGRQRLEQWSRRHAD